MVERQIHSKPYIVGIIPGISSTKSKPRRVIRRFKRDKFLSKTKKAKIYTKIDKMILFAMAKNLDKILKKIKITP